MLVIVIEEHLLGVGGNWQDMTPKVLPLTEQATPNIQEVQIDIHERFLFGQD